MWKLLAQPDSPALPLLTQLDRKPEAGIIAGQTGPPECDAGCHSLSTCYSQTMLPSNIVPSLHQNHLTVMVNSAVPAILKSGIKRLIKALLTEKFYCMPQYAGLLLSGRHAPCVRLAKARVVPTKMKSKKTYARSGVAPLMVSVRKKIKSRSLSLQ